MSVAPERVVIRLDPKNKIRGYRLADPARVRRRALRKYISHTTREGSRLNAKRAKSRLNVLRIYRKHTHRRDCAKITRDMVYIDSMFPGKTRDICKKNPK